MKKVKKETKIAKEKVSDKIMQGHLTKYFNVTREALEKAMKSRSRFNEQIRNDFLDMIQRYYEDAVYFQTKGNFVNAFAALNYAHGWLDAGARIGVFLVKDSRLFAA